MRQDFIRGRYANLEGCRTGNGTLVYSLFRTDRTGPIWQCQCSCRRYFLAPHSRIAPALQSGATVHCGNCVISGNHRETIADVRRAEHQQQQKEERERASRHAEAVKQAAKKKAEGAEKSRWRTVATFQFDSGIEINSPEWISFERWQSWSPEFQQEILSRVIAAKHQKKKQEEK